MPRLVRLYITQTVIGFGLSAAFVASLMWFNVANLWHLISGSDIGLLALLLLWVFNGIVFAGVQFGITIMRMGQDGQGGGGKRQPELSGEPALVPAEAVAPQHRKGLKPFFGRACAISVGHPCGVKRRSALSIGADLLFLRESGGNHRDRVGERIPEDLYIQVGAG